MPYTKAYRVTFENAEVSPADRRDVEIRIFDTDTFTETGDQFYTELIGNGGGLSTIDNDESKQTPIRGTQLTFNIKYTNQIALHTFGTGEDDKFLVEVYLDSVILFKGYLVMDDNYMPFLPPGNGEDMTLTATDNLGTLSEIPLTKPDGENPHGKYTIIEYIAWALQKTNLQLKINVACNLTEEDFTLSGSVANPFTQTYLSALTFEEEIGVSEDCRSVLDKIMFSWGLTLFQRGGEWWIMRIDEMQHINARVVRFTYLGVPEAFNDNEWPYQEIGSDETLYNIHLVDEASGVYYERPNKFVKQTFNFHYPIEIICNIDFARGDFSAPLSGVGYSAFILDEWTLKRGAGATETTPNVNAFIKRKFDDNGYETERYAVLTIPSSQGNPKNYIESCPVPVGKEDKFIFSGDWSAETDNDSNDNVNIPVGSIWLAGDDGTFWKVVHAVDDDPIKWVATNFADSYGVNANIIDLIKPSEEDVTEWRRFTVEPPPVPVDGKLYIRLNSSGAFSTTGADDFNIRFQNLQFTYTPYINSTHRLYSAQYHKAYQGGNYKANKDDEVFISDSPRKLFKGAMFKKGFSLVHSGAVTFSAGFGFSTFGDTTAIFTPGSIVRVEDSTLNNKLYTVVSSTFIASQTDIVTTEATVFETDTTVNIYKQDTEPNALTELWYDGILGLTGGLGLERFGKWQAVSWWNQYRYPTNQMDIECYGLDSAEALNFPSLLTKFYMRDGSIFTTDKIFMLLHYEIDLFECTWSGRVAEITDSNVGPDYDPDHEFKYVRKD